LGVQLTFNFLGLVLASVVFNIPFMVQPIQRAFEAIPTNLSEAAAVSGLNAWQTFVRVELPLAWPGILSAAVLTFVHTLGEFGVVLMMGVAFRGQDHRHRHI
jgi:molybdate transport system permease protein